MVQVTCVVFGRCVVRTFHNVADSREWIDALLENGVDFQIGFL